jgi:hypothetical protein
MRRSVFVAAVLLLAITLFALPANAGKPNPASAATKITVVGSCSFLVTYTWSGFSGSGLAAEVALESAEAGGAKLFFGRKDFFDQAGSGGSVSATFTLAGAPSTHRFFGYGVLFKIGGRTSIVRNSYVESSALDPQECGEQVTIS